MAPTDNSDRSRFGLHYFPDTNHYRENDLRSWLPELRSLGAGWLSLIAPTERAIPEQFILGLLTEGIQPILHFHIDPVSPPAVEEMKLLLQTYGDWGVKYAVFFDRPNRRRAWATSDWSQQDLVERFLDLFIPLADCAVQCGLMPVFPPLEPGGDYWDTAFLRTALSALRRRADAHLLQNLAMGALGRAGNRPLNWGAGGPERWPGARPYLTAPGEEDQLGFRTFDWYLPIMQAVLGRKLPTIVFGAGSQIGDHSVLDLPPVDERAHAIRNLALVQLIENYRSPGIIEPLDPMPEHVICTCFWLLAAEESDACANQAWFPPDGKARPIVGALRQWRADQRSGQETEDASKPTPFFPNPRIIAHYFLLPTYEWGIADWHLDVIRSFVKDHRPTIGFSLVEAAHATRVTVVGGDGEFPDAALEDLRAAGCEVERVQGNGTTIATTLGRGSPSKAEAATDVPIISQSREHK